MRSKNSFGADWLTLKGDNPVQILWNRSDLLATNELLLLGNAILRGEAVNSTWVKNKVKEIKASDDNNRRGAVYELLALSMFKQLDSKVKPAPNNQPGYDLVVELPSGGIIKISLKHFGISHHYSSLRGQCVQIERVLVAELAKRKLFHTAITVRSTEYLNSEDWISLRDDLVAIVEQFANCRRPRRFKKANYLLAIDSLIPDEHLFSSNHVSYIFRLFSPYYKNETINLQDKIEYAFANFEKHVDDREPKVAGLVLVRVPETVSLTSCKDWVHQYLQDTSESSVDAVLIYQTAVAKNLNSNMLAIHHSTAWLTTDRFNEWLQNWSPNSPLISMEVLMGICSSPATSLVFTDGSHIIPLSDNYVFQSGHYYEEGVATGNREQAEAFRDIGPGIAHSVVIKPPGSKGKGFILTPKAPINNDLLLL